MEQQILYLLRWSFFQIIYNLSNLTSNKKRMGVMYVKIFEQGNEKLPSSATKDFARSNLFSVGTNQLLWSLNIIT